RACLGDADRGDVARPRRSPPPHHLRQGGSVAVRLANATPPLKFKLQLAPRWSSGFRLLPTLAFAKFPSLAVSQLLSQYEKTPPSRGRWRRCRLTRLLVGTD